MSFDRLTLALRNPPYNIQPVIANEQNIFIKDALPPSEPALYERLKLHTFPHHRVVSELIPLIQHNETFVHDDIYFQRTNNLIQVFLPTDKSINATLKTSVKIAVRILINRTQLTPNAKPTFQINKIRQAAVCIVPLRSTPTQEIATRIQSAEISRNFKYFARTHHWCIAEYPVTSRTYFLFQFMRRYDMDLTQYVAVQFPISLASRVRILHDATQGLRELHTHNPCFIHRDIKPENLFVNIDLKTKEVTKLRLGDGDLITTVTPTDARTKQHAGSLSWIPDEVAKILLLSSAERPRTAPSVNIPALDVGALGLVMQFLETGRMTPHRWLFLCAEEMRWAKFEKANALTATRMLALKQYPQTEEKRKILTWIKTVDNTQVTPAVRCFYQKWVIEAAKERSSLPPLAEQPTYQNLIAALKTHDPAKRPSVERILKFVEASQLLVPISKDPNSKSKKNINRPRSNSHDSYIQSASSRDSSQSHTSV